MSEKIDKIKQALEVIEHVPGNMHAALLLCTGILLCKTGMKDVGGNLVAAALLLFQRK